jgi:hypothetical protein
MAETRCARRARVSAPIAEASGPSMSPPASASRDFTSIVSASTTGSCGAPHLPGRKPQVAHRAVTAFAEPGSSPPGYRRAIMTAISSAAGAHVSQPRLLPDGNVREVASSSERRLRFAQHPPIHSMSRDIISGLIILQLRTLGGHRIKSGLRPGLRSRLLSVKGRRKYVLR